MQLAELTPSLSLLWEDENSRLIDEGQMARQLWDGVRHDVDV